MIICVDGQVQFAAWWPWLLIYAIGYFLSVAVLVWHFDDPHDIEFSLFMVGLISVFWPIVFPILIPALTSLFIKRRWKDK